MKTSSRAIRRFHRVRLIKKYMGYESVRWRHDETENHQQTATRLVNHIKNCSCNMCGNHRNNDWVKNYDRLTMQEKKAQNRYECDLIEVDILHTI